MFELSKKLKQVSTGQLETAVSEAINKASGAKSDVSIESVDYESTNLSVKITLRLSEIFE